MNSGHVTSVHAYASQCIATVQPSEVISAGDKLLKIRIRMTFGPHGISLFTELEHLCTFVHYLFTAE